MGIRKSDKQVNYSHELARTKQQVAQCIVGALLVHGRTTGKHELTKFTKAQTWGNTPPSPLYYSLCLATGPAPKCHFVLGLPSWNLEIPEILEIGTPAALEAHNFFFRPLIEIRLKKTCSPLQYLSNGI
jgi:hypothetical protein